MLAPVSPYGRSKLMVEWMLEDAGRAHDIRSVVLRYFNVAGADPKGRAGQSTRDATHLIKVAVQAALGRRSHLDIFGTDYPTPDGTCLRDYIQVTDLAAGASRRAPLSQGRRRQPHLQRRLCPRLLGARGRRCGQERCPGSIFRSGCRAGGRATPPRSSPRTIASRRGWAGRRNTTISPPSCARLSNGSAACTIGRAIGRFGRSGTHGASCGSSIPAPSSRTRGAAWAR